MATTTALDAVCGCGCAKGCHRTEMRWGERVRTGCRHCQQCTAFAERDPDTPAAPPAPEVLSEYKAYACRGCGARYGQPYTDHQCGPLTPVTVTIAVRTPEAAR